MAIIYNFQTGRRGATSPILDEMLEALERAGFVVTDMNPDGGYIRSLQASGPGGGVFITHLQSHRNDERSDYET
jgi:hypothetical protein